MLPSLLLCMSVVTGCLLAGKILLHSFQLESYQFPGYFRTLRRNLLKAMLPGISMTVLLTVAFVLGALFSPAQIAEQGIGPRDFFAIAFIVRCVLYRHDGGPVFHCLPDQSTDRFIRYLAGPVFPFSDVPAAVDRTVRTSGLAD